MIINFPLTTSLMTEQREVLLDINGLKTWFRSQRDDDERVVKAVDGIDLRIHRGETFCLVGESGSGKSITALSIMGLLAQNVTSHPDGSILFHPQHQQAPVDLLRLQEQQMRAIRGSQIAMIFQEPMNSLNPVFTIGEQIIEALLLHHPELSYEAARLKAIQALTDVQIPGAEQRLDNYPHQLSEKVSVIATCTNTATLYKVIIIDDIGYVKKTDGDKSAGSRFEQSQTGPKDGRQGCLE